MGLLNCCQCYYFLAGDLEALLLLPVVSMRAALCLNRDLRTTQMFIMSLPLPVKRSATYDQQESFTLPCQVTTEYVYICECICTCACICVHIYIYIYIYKCMHMYICNKCVIKIRRTAISTTKYSAVTARSVFSKHSHNRHTIARPHGRDMVCLLQVKSMISYSVSITTVLHTIWGLYSSALWRHSAPFTNCTAHKGKKFLLTPEREICTDNIADEMQRNIIKSENVSPWLCQKIYYVSLINFVAYNPAISCICRTLPVYIITDASL